jgi:ubiquinone/menaquinone biosynthesis C-methylase UbiE
VFKYKRLLWAARKIRLPIAPSALVLDVGSGDNPHPRADVLVDRLTGAEHRGGAPMLVDRTAVLGDATKLPFKDKSFDFVIASHVLEHMPNPALFLTELQRVAHAGYIETPNSIYENLNPSKAHCLEISLIDNRLRIYKKKESSSNSLNFFEKNLDWRNLHVRNPGLFHVQYHWKDKIDFEIMNPEVSCQWVEEIYKQSTTSELTKTKLNTKGWRKWGGTFYSSYQTTLRKSRLKNVHLESLLRCPKCFKDLDFQVSTMQCISCKSIYASRPIFDFESVEQG